MTELRDATLGSEPRVSTHRMRAAVATSDVSLVARMLSALRRNAWEIGGVTALFAAVVAVHHGWLTAVPVSAGDWPWLSEDQARAYVPWPHVIDGSVGVSAPDFSGLNSAPFRAAIGGLIWLGFSSGVAEKLLVFGPFCILSVLSPWLLAREVLPRRQWALLAALLFAANTQVIDYARGEMGIGVAVTLAPLVLWSHLRALRTGRMWKQAGTGALLALVSIYDVRVAFIVVMVLGVGYAVELCVRRVPIRVLMQSAAVGGAVFIGLSLYWLVPLALYHGSQHLPIYPSLFVAFPTLTHAMAAQDPFWTGGALAVFHSAPVDPLALAVPLVAVVALAVTRRFSAPLLWIMVAYVLGVFMLKQQNAPFGEAYAWFFFHFPGGRLFRESSKFAWVAVTGLSILVTHAVSELWPRRGAATSTRLRRLLRLGPRTFRRCRGGLAAGLAMSLVGLSVWHLVPLGRGDIGWTTTATPLPDSFQALQSMLDADHNPSLVAWLGTAVVNDNGQGHVLRVESPEHPLLELNGFTSPLSSFAGAFDPWYRYCPGGAVPFCYVQPGLMTTLARWYGVGYVVAPLGDDVGQLPDGVVRAQLVDGIGTALHDNPMIVGEGARRLAVWHVSDHIGSSFGAPAVARIAGRTEDSPQVVAALTFLDLPPVYTDPGLDGAVTPADTAVSGIAVVPQRDATYRIDRDGVYAALLSEGTVLPRSVDVDGQPQPIRWLSAPRNGYRAAGPFPLRSGSAVLDDRLGGAPLIAWSATTEAILDDGGTVTLPFSRPDSESFSIDARCCSLVGVLTQYDDAWTLRGSALHFTVADEFNGYSVPAHSGALSVNFGLRAAELAGILVTLVVVVILLVLRLVGGHRLHRAPALPITMTVGRTARILFIAGAIFAAFAWWLLFARWFGLPYVLELIAPSTNLATPEDAVTEALFAVVACLTVGGVLVLASSATIRGSREHE